MPKGHWKGEAGRERARAATRNLIASIGLEDAGPAEVAAVVTKRVFIEHGLGGTVLRSVYGGSAYAALSDLFPELRPWQMGAHVPQGCWHGEEGRRNGREATIHMLARLGLLSAQDGQIGDADPEHIAGVVGAEVFDREGLGVVLRVVYGGSPFNALKAVFPDLQPWQMATSPRDYWQGGEGRQHAREATRWFITKVGIDAEAVARADNQQLRSVTKAAFARHRLGGMLKSVYNNSPYEALADAIPGLRPWQMGKSPRAYWQGEAGRKHAREATLWLLAQAGIDITAVGHPTWVTGADALASVDRAAFNKAGLRGMLAGVYRGSVQRALADVVQGLVP